MKKIINGRKYNTDTAKELGCCSHSYPSDFRYYSETLYQKKTGEMFLYGEGNGMSPYAEYVEGGGYTHGEDIVPLDEAKAREWAEKHLEVEEYESIFGEVEE